MIKQSANYWDNGVFPTSGGSWGKFIGDETLIPTNSSYPRIVVRRRIVYDFPAFSPQPDLVAGSARAAGEFSETYDMTHYAIRKDMFIRNALYPNQLMQEFKEVGKLLFVAAYQTRLIINLMAVIITEQFVRGTRAANILNRAQMQKLGMSNFAAMTSSIFQSVMRDSMSYFACATVAATKQSLPYNKDDIVGTVSHDGSPINRLFSMHATISSWIGSRGDIFRAGGRSIFMVLPMNLGMITTEQAVSPHFARPYYSLSKARDVMAPSAISLTASMLNIESHDLRFPSDEYKPRIIPKLNAPIVTYDIRALAADKVSVKTHNSDCIVLPNLRTFSDNIDDDSLVGIFDSISLPLRISIYARYLRRAGQLNLQGNLESEEEIGALVQNASSMSKASAMRFTYFEPTSGTDDRPSFIDWQSKEHAGVVSMLSQRCHFTIRTVDTMTGSPITMDYRIEDAYRLIGAIKLDSDGVTLTQTEVTSQRGLTVTCHIGANVKYNALSRIYPTIVLTCGIHTYPIIFAPEGVVGRVSTELYQSYVHDLFSASLYAGFVEGYYSTSSEMIVRAAQAVLGQVDMQAKTFAQIGYVVSSETFTSHSDGYNDLVIQAGFHAQFHNLMEGRPTSTAEQATYSEYLDSAAMTGTRVSINPEVNDDSLDAIRGWVSARVSSFADAAPGKYIIHRPQFGYYVAGRKNIFAAAFTGARETDYDGIDSGIISNIIGTYSYSSPILGLKSVSIDCVQSGRAPASIFRHRATGFVAEFEENKIGITGQSIISMSDLYPNSILSSLANDEQLKISSRSAYEVGDPRVREIVLNAP